MKTLKLSTFLISSAIIMMIVLYFMISKENSIHKEKTNPFDDVIWVKKRSGAAMDYYSYWPYAKSDTTEDLGAYVGSRGGIDLFFKDLVGDSVPEVIGVDVFLGMEGWEKHILKAYKDSTGQTRFNKIYFENRWIGDYDSLNKIKSLN